MMKCTAVTAEGIRNGDHPTEKRKEKTLEGYTTGRSMLHPSGGKDFQPRVRFATIAILSTLFIITIVSLIATRWLAPTTRDAPVPPPMLRSRFDTLLTTLFPGIHLSSPVFEHTTYFAMSRGRRDVPVWIADAQSKGIFGIRIVLDADTGVVKQFSCGIWMNQRPLIMPSPDIRTETEARLAARRFLLCLTGEDVSEHAMSVVAPEVPWGRWVITSPHGDYSWYLSLDAQMGYLRDFREKAVSAH